jgi:hypothetical protein
MRGPLFRLAYRTQGRADYLPRKLATNRDGRIRRKEPLQGGLSRRGLPATEILATRRLAKYEKYYSIIVGRLSRANGWQSIIMRSKRKDTSVEDNL